MTKEEYIPALLALEDGRIFWGKSFTGQGEASGEIVFNTSMTGYQEVLTDPSYKGQIVTMTYPLIGNYGVNPEDIESDRIQVEAFVIREYQPNYSNWRARYDLATYLKKQGILGIEGIDTRAITRHIRLEGAMRCYISTKDLDPESMIEKARSIPSMVGQDLVHKVTSPRPYRWVNGEPVFNIEEEIADANVWEGRGYRVVALDFGIKYNILRSLEEVGCEVIVLPAKATSEEIASIRPHGIFLSNGPGDPEPLDYIVKTIKELLGHFPIFGICLGHQLLGLALGGKTYKLKFGHRGANQPVKNLFNGRVEITSQNHGFAVDENTLSKDDVEITHINLNDNTLEGLRHKKMPVFSVQYHPEASPGPHDAKYLFNHFIELMQDA